MQNITLDYDEEADVLYVSFGRSAHVTGIELTDNIVLRLDTDATTGAAPRAIGLTFISFAQMMLQHRDQPITVSLARLRNLPEEVWRAVLTVVTAPPVSDFLDVGLSLSPQTPPLPTHSLAQAVSV